MFIDSDIQQWKVQERAASGACQLLKVSDVGRIPPHPPTPQNGPAFAGPRQRE